MMILGSSGTYRRDLTSVLVTKFGTAVTGVWLVLSSDAGKLVSGEAV